MQPLKSDTLADRVMRALGGRVAIGIAGSIWIITLLVTCWSVARQPLERTVTTNYRIAAEAFWHQQPMYSQGQHGWLYPPQGAVLYSLFSSIPSVAAGEVLWRIVITAAFVWSLYKLSVLAAGRLNAYQPLKSMMFLIVSLGSIALAAGCMRNGQMNLPLAALFMLACCDLSERRWWRATLWLALALVAKPIALPMVMLAGLLFPALWWRLPLGLLLVALMPYLNPHWGYVTDQYVAAFHKMKVAGEPGAGVFSDLIGMMQVFPLLGPGKTSPLDLNPLLVTGLRGCAALMTLAFSYLALRRFSLGLSCFYLLLFCTGYLMLFNPRTEGNSYVMFVPAAAVLFAWVWLVQKRLVAALALLVALVFFAAAHEFYKDKLDSVWIRPLCTLLICIWAGAGVFRNRPPAKAVFARA